MTAISNLPLPAGGPGLAGFETRERPHPITWLVCSPSLHPPTLTSTLTCRVAPPPRLRSGQALSTGFGEGWDKPAGGLDFPLYGYPPLKRWAIIFRARGARSRVPASRSDGGFLSHASVTCALADAGPSAISVMSRRALLCLCSGRAQCAGRKSSLKSSRRG